jgi:hypothetical protein
VKTVLAEFYSKNLFIEVYPEEQTLQSSFSYDFK